MTGHRFRLRPTTILGLVNGQSTQISNLQATSTTLGLANGYWTITQISNLQGKWTINTNIKIYNLHQIQFLKNHFY
jgi:hypothetical protein